MPRFGTPVVTAPALQMAVPVTPVPAQQVTVPQTVIPTIPVVDNKALLDASFNQGVLEGKKDLVAQKKSGFRGRRCLRENSSNARVLAVNFQLEKDWVVAKKEFGTYTKIAEMRIWRLSGLAWFLGLFLALGIAIASGHPTGFLLVVGALVVGLIGFAARKWFQAQGEKEF